MLSRFFLVKLELYTYEQFCDITSELLSRHNLDQGFANVTANGVWSKSKDVRDCIRIGNLARTIDDVEFLIDKFFGPVVLEQNNA